MQTFEGQLREVFCSLVHAVNVTQRISSCLLGHDLSGSIENRVYFPVESFNISSVSKIQMLPTSEGTSAQVIYERLHLHRRGLASKGVVSLLFFFLERLWQA